MRKYYYVCPRCGRTWRYFWPRRKMKCGFCSQTWKTRKAKGTYSRFSFTATILWLAIAAIIALSIVEWKIGGVSKFVEETRRAVEQKAPLKPEKPQTPIDEIAPETTPESENVETANDGAEKVDASSLDFRSQATKEKYGVGQKNDKTKDAASTEAETLDD